MEIGRREFLGAAAMAAGGVLAGRGAGSPSAGKDAFIWAALLHMGMKLAITIHLLRS